MDNIKPNKKLYFIPLIILLIGITVLVISIVQLTTGRIASFSLPNQPNISIEKAGRYDIYYEYTGFNQFNRDSAVFEFTHKKTGKIIQSRQTNATGTYSINQRKGVLVASITIDQSGEYMVTCSDQRQAYDFTLRKNIFTFVGSIFGIILGAFAIVLFAPIGFVIILFMRTNSKKKLMNSHVNYHFYPNEPN